MLNLSVKVNGEYLCRPTQVLDRPLAKKTPSLSLGSMYQGRQQSMVKMPIQETSQSDFRVDFSFTMLFKRHKSISSQTNIFHL